MVVDVKGRLVLLCAHSYHVAAQVVAVATRWPDRAERAVYPLTPSVSIAPKHLQI